MTEAEFESRLRQMAKAGGQASSRDLTGMAADIRNALEELDLFSSILVRKTGEAARMLTVRARVRNQALEPKEIWERLSEAFDEKIRYSQESFRWAAIEGRAVRLRFATQGGNLWVSGEIVAELSPKSSKEDPRGASTR